MKQLPVKLMSMPDTRSHSKNFMSLIKWVFSTVSFLFIESYCNLICRCIMFIFILELRRSWIVGDCPPVSEIISEIPCFKKPAVVSNFCYSTFNNFIP